MIVCIEHTLQADVGHEKRSHTFNTRGRKGSNAVFCWEIMGDLIHGQLSMGVLSAHPTHISHSNFKGSSRNDRLKTHQQSPAQSLGWDSFVISPYQKQDQSPPKQIQKSTTPPMSPADDLECIAAAFGTGHFRDLHFVRL